MSKNFKIIGRSSKLQTNDLRNADYSQSKNKHLWTIFKHPNENYEITQTFLGEIFLVLEGGVLTFGKKFSSEFEDFPMVQNALDIGPRTRTNLVGYKSNSLE